ncbi:ATP-binding protein [Streptomyces sp. NPDC058280]|uniref:sensor histidine kinase n=1 Tax=Streptomyces sp. NPDC058280 TaxID=3346419 RepID=UPI0036E5CD9C
MSDLFPPASVARERAGRRHGKPSRRGPGTAAGLRARLVRLCVLPLAAVFVVGAAAAFRLPVSAGLAVVLAAVGVTVVGLSWWWARSTARAISEAAAQLADQATKGREQVEQSARRIRLGHRAEPPGPLPLGGSLFAEAQVAIGRLTHSAHTSLVTVSNPQRVTVVLNLARRMQTLVTKALASLEAVENDVEDPLLLKRLFGVDHLITRVRRQVENAAVVGGAVPQRFNEPTPVSDVLRLGQQEILDYSRVRIDHPVPGVVHGHVAADLIHVVAELAENATKFSPPDTVVEVRAQLVPAGLAIEIDDRGLPMSPEDLDSLNARIAQPDRFDVDEQLSRDGRIGAWVVARLARRHGILVRLGSNVYGGNRAVIVLHTELLAADQPSHQAVFSGSPSASGPVPREAPSRTAATPQQAPIPQVPLVSEEPGSRPRRHRRPAGPAPVQAQAPAPGERPVLPKRSGSHLAPQLLAPSGPSPATGSASEALASPDLMARFATGRDRANDTIGRSGTAGPAN